MKQSVFWKKVLVVIIAAVVTFTVVPAMKPMTAMAESNEFTDPYIAMLGEETTRHLDAYDVHWYKLDIPDDIRDQDIIISLMGKHDYNRYAYISVLRSDLTTMWDRSSSISDEDSAGADRPLTLNVSIGKSGWLTLNKGQTYYLKVYSDYHSSHGDYIFKISGDYLKASRLSLTAQKGKKSISVSTINNASVSVSANKAIINDNGKKVKKITVSSGDSGEVNLSLSRKLKKGDRIKVTVKKSGYETKKAQKKII